MRDYFAADEQSPIELKGFAKPVRCYSIRSDTDHVEDTGRQIREEQDGLRLQLDLDRLPASDAARVLENVLARLR